MENLQQLEARIERGFKSFMEVATALVEIHNRRLYLQAGYDTYRQYCRDRWGLGTTAAYHYIRAKLVIDEAPPEKAAQISLSQAVALSRMPKGEQREAFNHTDFSTTSSRSLLHPRTVKSRFALRKFSAFCYANPELGFWEALVEWMDTDEGSGCTPKWEEAALRVKKLLTSHPDKV